jgi:hypothetical protein
MNVLKWIFLAKDPLSLEELRHALAVELGDEKLDRENFVDGRLLLDCCLGLVIVDDSTSTLRLVHKSLHDYLYTQHNQRLLFEDGHDTIARACLTYIAFDFDFEHSNLRDGYFQEYYQFMQYATTNWNYHRMEATNVGGTVEEL